MLEPVDGLFFSSLRSMGGAAHLQTHLAEKAGGKHSLRGPETELKSVEKLPVAVLAEAYPFRAAPDEKPARGGTAGEPLAVSALRRSVRKVTAETLPEERVAKSARLHRACTPASAHAAIT